MPTRRTLSFNRTVHPEEIRGVIEQINLRDGLEFVTKESARAYREPDDGPLVTYNPLNLSLLAKAFVLWGNPEGRPLGRAEDGQDERLWLLAAANSLPWHSRDAVDQDIAATMASFFVRQAHMILATDDPLDANIARTYAMFHQIIGRGGFTVPDPSAELLALYGVSAEDLWVVALAIFSFYVSYAHINPNIWVFTPDFFAESPRAAELRGTLDRALARIARTPEELRALYAADPDRKYRDRSGAVGAWISEFNILRDFPVVRLAEDQYCSPFPAFAFTRGSVGFYFDLVDEYARRERAEHPENDNPYDNAMSQTLGEVFQTYVGDHLRELEGSDEGLRAEFGYGPNEAMRTPDWILRRAGRVPVFFECKARRPMLDLQRSARPADIRLEIERVVARALKQFTRFLLRADGGTAGIAPYGNLDRYIYALVLYEPFAFHALPQIRAEIDHVAAQIEPRWNDVKHRVLFVPMGVRELETAVGLELNLGVPLEQQLTEYAAYRASAPRVVWEGETAHLPMHLEEFVQVRWNESRRVVNPVCQRLWDEFCAHAYRRIFDQDIAEYEAEARRSATEALAYRLWEERGRPLWDAERDWHRAEERLDEGELPGAEG